MFAAVYYDMWVWLNCCVGSGVGGNIMDACWSAYLMVFDMWL